MIVSSLSSSRPVPFYATPFGVWAVVAAWGLAHVLLRALWTPVLGTDDMFENIFVQELSAGYILRQPPLYEWLLWGVQQVTGPVIWSFLLLKYGLTSVSALFLFLIARRAMDEPRLAALCVFSYSLFYQFGWNLHEGVTHTVVLVTACSASAYLFLRALETGRLLYYVAFGVAVGAGFLSKHSYPLFVMALVLAAVSDRSWRVHFKPAALGLTALAAGVVYSPYFYWVTTEGLPLFDHVADTMGVQAQSPHLLRAGEGLGKLAFALVGFSVPLMPILGLLFWQRLAGRMTADQAHINETARFCGRTVLWMVGLTGLLILLSGATYVKERHMHPLLILLPIWVFADLARFEAGRRWRWLALAVAIVASVAFFARVPGMAAPDRFWCGGKCRHMKPYADLKEPLAALGAEAATLIGADDYTGGNLRVLFPQARVMTPELRIGGAVRQTCLFVWEEGEQLEEATSEEALARFKSMTIGGKTGYEALSARYAAGAWPHLWKPPGWRTTWWGIAELPPEADLCR